MLHPSLGWGTLLVALVLVAYAPALRNGYVWDDDLAITDNPLLGSVHGLWRIWLEPRAIPQGHYWPLVYTSFWIEYQLWGDAPLGYHATNILLHAANALLVWRLLVQLAVPGAWVVAAIFAVHPLRVESVAWVIERKDVFSGFFYLTAVSAYVRFLHSGRRYEYAVALAGLFCALLAKSMAVTLPVVLLLLLWWKNESLKRNDLLRLVPFAALSLAAIAMELLVVREHETAEGNLSLLERFLVAGRALWFYAGKLVWPSPLLTIYPKWQINAHEPLQFVFPLGAASIVAILWGLRLHCGRGPLVAVLSYVAALAPVLGFVDFGFTGYSYVADRFQYLAGIGLVALLVAPAAAALDRLGRDNSFWMGAGRIPAALLLVVLMLLTARECTKYRNLETLFRHNLRWTPESIHAGNHLAAALIQQRRYEEALRLCESVLARDPTNVTALVQSGMILAETERKGEAIAYYRRALTFQPTNIDALYNLGLALAGAGQLEEAEQRFLQLLAVRTEDHRAHYNLGLVRGRRGDLDGAIAHFETALRLHPRYAEAHNNLGLALQAKGERARAVEHFRQALRIRPDYAAARRNLVNAGATP